jgi:hypothetical protein
MAFNFDEDGLLDIIYHFAWQKANPDISEHFFFLPDTVIYKYQQPRFWYFTSKDGSIKKRSQNKLKTDIIKEFFTKNVSQSEIVAWFMYIDHSKKIVEFLNLENFNHFLYSRKKSNEGILQKFIDPKGTKNSMIQVVWMQKFIFFEVRENKKNLFDTRFDLYERAVTFEGEEFHCETKQVCSEKLQENLYSLISRFTRHISEVTSNKLEISRMVLYFKQSKDGRIWLVRACSVRCRDNLLERSSELTRRKNKFEELIVNPINIDPDLHLPETVNIHKFSLAPQSAMALQKTVLCRNCSLPMEVDKMCEISYRIIVEVNNGNEIPELIQKIDPQINPVVFEKMRNNPLFLSKQTLVCDSCFLLFTERSKNSGALPRPVLQEYHRITPLDPAKVNKRREITNFNINSRLQTSSSEFRIHRNAVKGLPRVSTAVQLGSQKSLAKALGIYDITAFLEEKFANRKLVTR